MISYEFFEDYTYTNKRKGVHAWSGINIFLHDIASDPWITKTSEEIAETVSVCLRLGVS